MRKYLKGWVHPKNEKFSHFLLSSMPMESPIGFHSPQNISGASRQNSILQDSWSSKMALYSSSKSPEVLGSQIDLKRHYLDPWGAVELHALTSDMLRSEARVKVVAFKKGINNVFSNLFGILGLLEICITPDKLFFCCCCCWYLLFKRSLHLLQLFGRMLFCCSAPEMSREPQWRWADNDCIHTLNLSFKLCFLTEETARMKWV